MNVVKHGHGGEILFLVPRQEQVTRLRASNFEDGYNAKDISTYIEEYRLRHTDTARILMEALEKGSITEEQGNQIWKEMLLKRRKLPRNSFSEYLVEKK